MKKISEANPNDFDFLLSATKALKGFATAQELAQAFVDTSYEHFSTSLILLRLFSTAPYSVLSSQDRQLVDRKANDSETAHLLNDRVPVLTLLGTRGRNDDWNERDKSQGFRCIPLISSKYVRSLSMLSMQFKNMNFDFSRFDNRDISVFDEGSADRRSRMLYVKDARADRDDQDRMVVPRQEFVAEYGVKTVLGFGCGYPDHPAIAILFAFTDEILERPVAEPFSRLLEGYVSASKDLIGSGLFFSSQATAL